MAVTVGDLAVALRVVADPADTLPAGQSAVLARNLDAALALVAQYAPAARADVADEATIRAAGWLYDMAPHESARAWSALKHSGAAGLLSPWRSRRLAGVGGLS